MVLVAAILLFSQPFAIVLVRDQTHASSTNEGGATANWLFKLGALESASVVVSVNDITEPTLQFMLPKTYEALRIDPSIDFNVKPENGSSWDWLIINNTGFSSFTFTFTWPDAALLFEDWFYFSGQESLWVGYTESSGHIIVELPETASQILIDEPDTQISNNVVSLHYSEKREVPRLKYKLTQQPSFDSFESKTSEHVTLRYHRLMRDKPWLQNTVSLIEQNWNWAKALLNGTLSRVDVAFVPYGYRDLGKKYGGVTYDGSRNIEIAAIHQFGIGFEGWNTALLFHELTHAFTVWMEYLPHFYLESIAQEVSYDALRRINMTVSASWLEQSNFADAYEGIQADLLKYIWIWEWNDTIYDNPTITKAVYGVATFLGDYMVHLAGYAAYNRVAVIFNRTEIESLNESQKLVKFTQYLSIAFNHNMTQLLSNLESLVFQWKKANDLRLQNYTIEVSGPFTWSLKSRIDDLAENGALLYEKRAYQSSANKFEEAQASLANAGSQRFIDFVFWAVLLSLVIFVIKRVRHTKRRAYYLVLSLCH